MSDGATEEKLMEHALDAGAEDIQGEDGTFQVLGAPADLIALRTAIESAGMTVESAEIVWIPLQTVSVPAETAAVVERQKDSHKDHNYIQHLKTNNT